MTGAGVPVAVGDGVGASVSLGSGEAVGMGRRVAALRVPARGEAVGSGTVAVSSGSPAVGRSVPTTAGTRKPMASSTTATTACARRRSAVRMAPSARRRGRDTGGKMGQGGGDAEVEADARGVGGADGEAGRARCGSALLKGIAAAACTTRAGCATDRRTVPALTGLARRTYNSAHPSMPCSGASACVPA